MLAAMAVSVTVLASGSKGNCTVISSSGTRLLVDAGLSCREMLDRMRLCGHDPHDIDAIVITHEHTDHIGGLRVLAKRLKIPVYITAPTYHAYQKVRPRQCRQPHRAGAGRAFLRGQRLPDRRHHGDAVYHLS